MALTPGFQAVAGFVFAPPRPKKKYDAPVKSWTNDQKIIEDLSEGALGTTLSFKHGYTYDEFRVKIYDRLFKKEVELEQHENLLRVCHSDLKTKLNDEIKTILKELETLRKQIENALHNAELDLIKVTKHRSNKTIMEVIDKRLPVFVEDDERVVHAVYFHKQSKILGTGDVSVPRLGVTFTELGIRPVHFYGVNDPKYMMILEKYNEMK